MFCRTHIQIQVENKQNAQSRKCNVDSTPKSQAKAHSNEAFWPSTDMAMAQAHRGTDHAKAVARWPHQGAGTPGVRPHPCHCLLGPASSGGCKPPCYVGPWWFPKIPAPNRPWIIINKRVELTTSFGASTSLPPTLVIF